MPRAKFEFIRDDSDGTRVKYFEIELANVLIGMAKPHLAITSPRIKLDLAGSFTVISWKPSRSKVKP